MNKVTMLTLAGCLCLGLGGCTYPNDQEGLSDEEITEIRALLASQGTEFTLATVNAIKTQASRVDPKNYRLVLPVFDRERLGNVIVGSETLGTLPISEVRKLASLRGVEYVEEANAQSVIWQDLPGGHHQGGVDPPPPGAGCSSDHKTQGLGDRIYDIIQNIDQSQYQFLH